MQQGPGGGLAGAPGWSSGSSLPTRPADQLVPRVGVDGFASGPNRHALVAPAVPVPLTIPRIFGGKASDVKIQVPENMPAKPQGFFSPVTGPEMTVSRLAEVCCLPGGLAITATGTILTESFGAPWETRFHRDLEFADGLHRPRHPIVSTARLAGKYFLADYMHLHHYGHFLVDVVPRLWGYLWCRDFLGMAELKLLLHPSMPAYVQPMLQGLGIAEDRVETIAAPVIVEELFVATKSFQIQGYTTPLAAGLFTRIRDALAPVMAATPRRLYISRSRIAQRVLTDEALIEALFVARGFTVIHPQELSIVEQLGLIANAELIAGPSGSNLFNLAFQRSLRSCLIIVSAALIHWSDVFLQAYHGNSIYYYIGSFDLGAPGFRPGDVHAPWRVDLPSFERAVDNWIAQSSNRRPNWGSATG